MPTRANVEATKEFIRKRLGNPYVYGGALSNNVRVGTDCSEVWQTVLEMAFGRWVPGRQSEGATTESYRYIPVGGRGPFGTIRVAHWRDIPANAAAKLAFHHAGNGGAAAHMWGELDGMRIESGGSKGLVTAPRALAIDNSYANAWAYLPGPIVEDGTPPAPELVILGRNYESRGERVKALQMALNAKGANLEVDGDFGPATEAAVTAYQRANGLDIDGVAGSQTLGHLGLNFQTPRPTPNANAAGVLARATGLSHARATEILPTMIEGLKLAQCNTVPRIAQFIAHTGHESDGYKATEEYAKNGRYAPYIGRTWMMITWDYHYRDFSEWAHARGLVPTPDYFVRDYRALADLRWAGIGASWYWTEQRPMNALVDAGDAATWRAGDRTYRGFEAVTAAINGGLNGLADRRERCRRAMNLGDQLLALVATPEPADPLEELLMSELESWSIYATPGEPKIPAEKMLQAIDAANHRELVESAARLGDVDALARIARTAKGLGKYTDVAIREHAIAVLAEIGGKTKDEIREILKG